MMKKSFADNARVEIDHPVINTIVNKGTNVDEVRQETVEFRRKIREPFSRRLYVSVQPSTFNVLAMQAEKEELSMNQLINKIFKEYRSSIGDRKDD